MGETFNLDEPQDQEQEIESEESEESNFDEEIITHRKRGGNKKDLSDAPIENAEEIPLFANADKRGLRTAVYLNIYKLDAPGAGYKGQLPLNSTRETIAQHSGNGSYNIEVCNHKHAVLRSLENIKIDIPNINQSKPSLIGNGPIKGSDEVLTLIKSQHIHHKDEVERVREISERASKESIENSSKFVELVTKTTETAAQREREHMMGVNKNQQDFFANFMAAQSQMFQQTMAMMIMGHQQTIEMIKASNDSNNRNPMEMVQVLMSGLKIGKEFGGDDSPDWLQAIKEGGAMVKDISRAAILTQSSRKKLKSKNNENKEEVEEEDEEETTSKTVPKISKDELIEIIKLKNTLNKNGIDFTDMVRQAREYYAKPKPDSEKSEKSDESEPKQDT